MNKAKLIVFVAAMAVCLALGVHTPWLGMAATAALLLVAVVALVPGGARLIAWGLVALAVMLGLLVAAVASMAVFTFMLPLLLTVGTVCGVGLWLQLRRRRALAVLDYLEMGVRLNLPLPPLLKAAAQSERGGLALCLENLKVRLEVGQDMQTALLQAVPQTPSAVCDMVGVYERMGRLPRLFERLARRYDRADRTGSRLWQQVWWYVIGVMPAVALTILSVLALLSIYIFPMFREIFADFDAPVPPMTHRMIAIGNWLTAGGLFVVLMAILLALACGLLGFLTEGGRAAVEQVIWRVPVVRGLLMDRALAELCAVLEEGTRLGQPVHRTLQMAGDLSLGPILHRRVQNWAQGVESGQAVGDAAAAAGIPETIGGMMAAATTTQGMIDALAFLTRYYQSRTRRTAIFLAATAAPALIVAMGVPVAMVCLAILQPLVAIIRGAIVTSGAW